MREEVIQMILIPRLRAVEKAARKYLDTPIAKDPVKNYEAKRELRSQLDRLDKAREVVTAADTPARVEFLLRDAKLYADD